jgi:hypothetical protein
VLLIAEVLVHLRVERVLRQLAQQPARADQFDVLLLGQPQELLSKQLLYGMSEKESHVRSRTLPAMAPGS